MKNRKLIAEFMGIHVKKSVLLWGIYDNNGLLQIDSWTKKGAWEIVTRNCKFDTSWEWLMPVVDKIGNMGYNIEISRSWSHLTVTSDSKLGFFEFNRGHSDRGGKRSKLEATYLVVVAFIKWYNSK